MNRDNTKQKLKRHFEEQQNNIYGVNVYIEAANKGIEDLNEFISFINRMENDPTIIFTSLKNEMGDHKHNFFSAMKKYEAEDRKLMPHDFQKHLLEKLNEGLKTILEDEGVDTGYRITLSSPNTFPSKYLLYYEEEFLCRLDIINKLYGEAALQNEEHFLKLMKEKKKHIEEDEKEWEKLMSMKNKPYKAMKVFSDIFLVLFQRRKLKRAIYDRLSRLNRLIEEQEEELRAMEKEIPIMRSRNKKTSHTLKNIEPILKKYGYVLAENKYQLY